jgi:hypothetical protein
MRGGWVIGGAVRWLCARTPRGSGCGGERSPHSNCGAERSANDTKHLYVWCANKIQSGHLLVVCALVSALLGDNTTCNKHHETQIARLQDANTPQVLFSSITHHIRTFSTSGYVDECCMTHHYHLMVTVHSSEEGDTALMVTVHSSEEGDTALSTKR